MADEPTTTPPEDTPPERPDWLADRYSSVEDQAKAYAESQAEMNRMRSQMEQERQSFTAALEGMQAPAPAPQQGQAFDPALSAYAAAYEQGDVQGMLAAQAQYVQAPVIDAVGRLIDEKLSAITPAVQAAQAQERENTIRLAEGMVERIIGADRYAELAPQISAIAADHPHYLPQSSSAEGYRDAILNMAKLAEHDSLVRTNAELVQERNDKRAAQTLSPGYNRQALPADAAQAEFDRIKNTPGGTFAELLENSRKAG